MLNDRTRLVTWEICLLALVMGATRFSHEGSVFSLPDASLAVFFLAGLYCRGAFAFAMLFALAALVDMSATGLMGVSDYCLTPAYVFLIPAYACLWWAGRALVRRNIYAEHAWILRASMALIGSTSAAFIISNLSFYAFSGKVSQVSIGAYLDALTGYYWTYLGSTMAYAALGIFCIELLRSGLARVPKKALQ